MKPSFSRPDSLKLAGAFFAIYFIWGTTYLAAMVGLEGMKPFVLSALRYVIAGLLMAGWLVYRKMKWPDRKSIRVLMISGCLMLVGGSGLVVYGEQYINSGYAAVIVATEPLWFVLFDRKRWSFYFTNRKIIAGLLTGFAGIALFACLSNASTELRPGGLLPGTLIVLVSATLWVGGTLYANKNIRSGTPQVAGTTVQLLSGGICAGLIGLLLGEWNGFHPAAIGSRAWGALAFLVVFGSIIAYASFNWLMTVRPPAVVSTHTFVNPVVAIIIGWAAAGESLSTGQVAALAVVLAGVILTQTAKQQIAPEAE
ncbi:MAG: EamA family transporter [Chitinophagaceae bacterium]|nr:MAG: EamA family transporter [Chitinophagaceae bacterium]